MLFLNNIKPLEDKMNLNPANRNYKFSPFPASVSAGVLFLSVILFLNSSLVLAGSIKGTAHDLTSKGFGIGENCIICHTPHDSDISITVTPLWNHQTLSSTFEMYFTRDESLSSQPTGASKLCLSCHDGVTAIDKFGGRTTSAFMGNDGNANSMNRQSDSHPLSITFNSAMAENDPSLFDPAVKNITIGTQGGKKRSGTVAELLLPNGRVQCSSCHDVHNNYVGAGVKSQPFLKITKAGSQICLTCHNR